MEFGMSDLGPVNFGPDRDITEWGKSLSEQNMISDAMLMALDKEIKKFIDDGYKSALTILKKHRKKLDAIAEALMKKETIETDEFELLMGGPKRRDSMSEK